MVVREENQKQTQNEKSFYTGQSALHFRNYFYTTDKGMKYTTLSIYIKINTTLVFNSKIDSDCNPS